MLRVPTLARQGVRADLRPDFRHGRRLRGDEDRQRIDAQGEAEADGGQVGEEEEELFHRRRRCGGKYHHAANTASPNRE
ncbi:MAG: hypothetical protein K0S48_75 [Ramlibacter sp.]|nr:hypothetical protein [Ramlibacter sp.]